MSTWPLIWLAATLAAFGCVALPVFLGCWLFARVPGFCGLPWSIRAWAAALAVRLHDHDLGGDDPVPVATDDEPHHRGVYDRADIARTADRKTSPSVFAPAR